MTRKTDSFNQILVVALAFYRLSPPFLFFLCRPSCLILPFTVVFLSSLLRLLSIDYPTHRSTLLVVTPPNFYLFYRQPVTAFYTPRLGRILMAMSGYVFSSFLHWNCFIYPSYSPQISLSSLFFFHASILILLQCFPISCMCSIKVFIWIQDPNTASNSTGSCMARCSSTPRRSSWLHDLSWTCPSKSTMSLGMKIRTIRDAHLRRCRDTLLNPAFAVLVRRINHRLCLDVYRECKSWYTP